MERTNQYFVVNKHNRSRVKGKDKLRKWSRKFYDDPQLAFETAKMHASECDDDFLVVQVISEASRPTPRAVDGGQAGDSNGQVALPTATNA